MTVHILGVGLNGALQAFWMHCVDGDKDRLGGRLCVWSERQHHSLRRGRCWIEANCRYRTPSWMLSCSSSVIGAGFFVTLS